MAREDPQMKLRLPAELKARVEEAAQLAGRSLNAEIVHRLEQSFLGSEGFTESFIDNVTDAVAKQLSRRYALPNIEAKRTPETRTEGQSAKAREGEN